MGARRALWAFAVVALSLPGWLQPISAQQKATPASPERARQILISQAHALESRGRPDMAIQIWQQVLLSDPKNAEALAGLARDYKLSGNLTQADAILQRLRAVNPNDPNIANIEALASTRAQVDRLRQAGNLARQGHNEDAMRIYRELYGDRPPDGDIALAYYQTMYGTAQGKQQAIEAMRALAARNPGDTRYAVALGQMLTYEAKTRAEGIRILKEHHQDPNAQTALRQALIWDSSNPSSAAELREFLKQHPQDTEIQQHLKESEVKLAQMNSGIARTPEERAAFAALNGRRLDEAQTRFTALLEKDPTNGRAAAGMGFLRMRQNNFAGAISYFTQAEQNGYKAKTVENALEVSRFWYTMGEATQAFNENELETAAAKYKEALVMRPQSHEALSGLAGLYMKQQQYAEAAAAYQNLLKIEPQNGDAWRGLFLSYARDGQNDQALAVVNRFPPAVKATSAKDPEYLRTLATIYRAKNRSADAQRVLAQALALPFPNDGTNLKEDTKLQYAGILMEANRFDQAAEMYIQILNDDAGSVPAWMGLVSAHHELGRENEAISDVEKMPPATYDAALNDAGFLSMLGAIYQQANQFDVAQNLLERTVKLQRAGGGQPSLAVQLQLAGIYLRRNNTDQAYNIYRQVLTAHPERADAWKGLIASLQVTNHVNEALQQIALIPPDVRKQLEADPEFVESEASLYAAAGDTAHATEYIQRVQAHYAQLKQALPANLAIQNAWLLYNTNNDRTLYPTLMRLGGRQDLTAEQRETIQTIWANWSVRRAGAALDNNDNQRAVDILEAASRAFPNNLTVRKVLAGGYVRTGEVKQALAIYKSVGMQDASAADFNGAIGAALAANDKAQAEVWLRQALERFPKDGSILAMAARFEQARGDNQRAADYWRASIAAMPATSPTDKLAHELAYPDVSNKPHTARTPAELQQLLNPDNEPFQKTAKLPPLPAYGPDPYLGRAPIVLPQARSAAEQPASRQQPAIGQQPAMITAPSTTQVPAETAPADRSTTTPLPVPMARAPDSTRPASGQAKRAKRTPPGNSGQVNLPPSEQNITTAAPSQPAKIQSRETPVFIPPPPSETAPAAPQQNVPPKPQSSVTTPQSGANPPLRITSQPVDSKAAQAQALFAEETDGQLTQGSASQIHSLGNAPVSLPSSGVHPALGPNGQLLPERTTAYNETQYTPSAQDAATGAYSAQKAQPTQQQPLTQTAPQKPSPQQPAATAPGQPGPSKGKAKRKAARTQTVPTLVTAPGEQTPPPAAYPQTPPPVQVNPETEAPPTPGSYSTDGLSDEELQQQNLPPLRGPWVRLQRQQRAISPREEAEAQLQSIESSYSPWMGGTGVINYRSGSLGYDHLSALEAPFEISTPFGYNARLTVVAKPVFLDAGQADGTSVITVQEATTGGTCLVTIAQPLGTAVNTGPQGTGSACGTTATTTTFSAPPQQNAAGVAGEVQLAFPHLALAAGYTPYGLLVSNLTGRAQFRPGNGPFTFSFVRDSVKDTQLSYGGLRDPGSASLSYPGTVWGGVIANQGSVQYARGDAQSGFYLGAGGQYLTGTNVQDNTRIDGNGGAYWRAKTFPEYGTLSVGVNFFGMHYAHNQIGFTFGMGGYFSPQEYFLGNVPVTWTGHYQTRWHYEIMTGLGVQAFQQDLTPLFPLAAQKANEVALNNAALPAITSVGANYNLRGTAAYQISPHWFAGGFLSANNSRNYASFSAGFSIHYLFRSQPSTVTAPTGLFPSEGFRPFTVP